MELMKFWMPLLFMASCLTALKSPYSCNTTSTLHALLKMDTDAPLLMAFNRGSLMTTGQTICFEFEVEDTGSVISKTKLFLSFVEQEEEYQVMMSYKFSLPNVKLQCECECPDNDQDKCNHDVENESFIPTNGNHEECIRTYSNGHTGCRHHQSAEVCCNVTLHGNNSHPEYVAIFVDKPVIKYNLTVGFVDEQEEIVGKAETIELSPYGRQSLMTGGLTFSLLRDQLKKPALSSKWYYMRSDGDVLLTGEPVNDLNERNLQKLGWYQFDIQRHLLPLDVPALQRSVVVKVQGECHKNDIDSNFTARFLNGASSGKTNIGHVVKDSQNVSLFLSKDPQILRIPLSSPLKILIRSQINTLASKVFYSQNTTLKTFSALADGSTLRLSLTEASGSFFVVVHHSNSSVETHYVTVESDKPINDSKEVHLSSNAKCPITVLVYANGSMRKPEKFSCDGSAILYTIIGVAAVVVGIVLFVGIFCLVKYRCCYTVKINPSVPEISFISADEEARRNRDSVMNHTYERLIYS